MTSRRASLTSVPGGSVGAPVPGRTSRISPRALLALLAALLCALPAVGSPERTDADGKGEGAPAPMVIMIPPANQAPPTESQDIGRVDIMKEKHRLLDRGAEDRAHIAAGYRDVLLTLGSAGRDAALSALFDFETGYMEGRHPKEVKQLLEAEVAVVRWLGVRDLESIVPLLALHHDAYRLYIERGKPILAGHSSRLAASMADLYARKGGSEGSRVLGARALASLGIYAQQMGVKLQGLGLLLAALEFDPHSEAALLGLATIHERSGNYHRAAEYLLKLLDAYPQHREGRLRMAVNLRRLGSLDDAQRLLEGLVAESDDDWVGEVAYEELSNLERAGNHLEKAEETLWAGLEHYPSSGRLRTQLALVLDLRHLPQRSLKVIQELPETAGRTAAPSARRLYGMGPQRAYEEARAALEESAASRVGRLARLLDDGGSQAPAGGAR